MVQRREAWHFNY